RGFSPVSHRLSMGCDMPRLPDCRLPIDRLSPVSFMVNRNLIREFDITEDEEQIAIGEALHENLDWLESEDVGPNQIVEGRGLRLDDDFVLVDVGYKSEGIIPRNEWEEGDEPPKVGETIRVLVEDLEDVVGRQDDRGMIVL